FAPATTGSPATTASVATSTPTTTRGTTTRGTTTRPTGGSTTTTTLPVLATDAQTAGKAAMAHAVGQLLGFAFPTDVLVLPTKTMAALMTPSLPISYTLQTSVQTETAKGLQTLF